MPSKDEIRFTVEELRLLQRGIEERIARLEETFGHEKKPEEEEAGNFDGLNWAPTKSGNGEIVFRQHVPAWVKGYGDIMGRDGGVVKGYHYKLFDSGVLWRKKV